MSLAFINKDAADNEPVTVTAAMGRDAFMAASDARLKAAEERIKCRENIAQALADLKAGR